MFTDQNGEVWSINADRTALKSESGLEIIINPEWTDHALQKMLVEFHPVQKTDAERIAELEAQVASLLAKLS